MKSIAFIGDIHGEAVLLEELLKKLSRDRTRHLVFLGDYVNLGGDSRRVIDLLLELKERWKAGITCLMGNHDLSLLDYIQHGSIVQFAATGGIPTIGSYMDYVDDDIHSAFVASFPASHLNFLKSLESYFEEPDIFASHSGVNPDDPSDRSLETMTGGGSFRAVRRQILPKFLICGHFLQYSFMPYITGWSACLDTGCGSAGGPLTGLLWPERDIVCVERRSRGQEHGTGDTLIH